MMARQLLTGSVTLGLPAWRDRVDDPTSGLSVPFVVTEERAVEVEGLVPDCRFETTPVDALGFVRGTPLAIIRRAFASSASIACSEEMNVAVARHVFPAQPEGAAVLIQDYHLCLVAPRVAERRPDLALVHFSHTPFAPPELLRVLPDAEARELLAGLAAHDACGFHCTRWAADFVASAQRVLGTAPPTGAGATLYALANQSLG